jgi:hypothetical protein
LFASAAVNAASSRSGEGHARGAQHLDVVAEYRDALPWLRAAATMIDTTGRAPAEVARLVAGHLG